VTNKLLNKQNKMEMLRYAYCYKLMQIEAQEQNSLTKKKGFQPERNQHGFH
jgi:hypothetical protein